MKKILLLFLILFLFPINVLADDDSSDSADWSTYTKNYDKLQNQRPVTDEQFNKALDTVNSMQKKKKKKTKKNKNAIDPQNIIEQSNSMDHTYLRSKTQLIMVPKDLYCNGTIIPTGFYIEKPLIEKSNSYLLLIQGGNVVAKVKADKITPDASDTEVYKAKLLLFDNYAKLIYSDIDNNLEAKFYIK